jgi:glycosyltransferase involved in cell wall biosynthesis
VGDGPARRNLENLANELDISKRVHFLGTVPHADLPGFYRMGDIFASTSLKEAFGFTLVEAMACNLPVIALDTAWTRELIQPDVSGYLCPDDLDEFGCRLVEMANNPMMRQQMGYHAQNASRKFTLAQSMDTMVSLYQRLLDARPEPD